MILIFSFREKGLAKVCDLIFDVMEARMVQIEVEKTDQEARRSSSAISGGEGVFP